MTRRKCDPDDPTGFQRWPQVIYITYTSDLGPILIIAYFDFFTLQVCKKIIEDTISENRFSISYSIVFLRLVMSVSVRVFLYTVSP